MSLGVGCFYNRSQIAHTVRPAAQVFERRVHLRSVEHTAIKTDGGGGEVDACLDQQFFGRDRFLVDDLNGQPGQVVSDLNLHHVSILLYNVSVEKEGVDYSTPSTSATASARAEVASL